MLKIAIAATFIGMGALPAQAAAPARGGYSNDGYHQRTIYAGTITIDGCTTRIRKNGHIGSQIARAFRNAGYSAHTNNGRVSVDFCGFPRPRVRWHADSYSLGMRWEYDSVRLTPRYRSVSPRRSRHYRPQRSRRWGSCR